MFKRILSIIIAMTLFSTSYAQINPGNSNLNKLSDRFNEILSKVSWIEQRGFSIYNNVGEKVSFADLVGKGKQLGDSFSVLAPVSRLKSRKENKPFQFQFKVIVRVNSPQIGVKIIDALDESVLGRTTLNIPTHNSIVVENNLALKALETQVALSLRTMGKIAKKEINSKRTIVEIFLNFFIPKSHAYYPTPRDKLYGLEPLDYHYGSTECLGEHWDGLMTYLGVLFLGLPIIGVFLSDNDKINGALARHKKLIFAILALPVLLIGKSSLECKEWDRK